MEIAPRRAALAGQRVTWPAGAARGRPRRRRGRRPRPRGLDAVVEGEQPGRLQHRRAGRPRPLRGHPRVDTRKQRQNHRQRDPDVHNPEQRPDPPGRAVQQRERGRVAEGETLPGAEVEEEPDDPGPVGIPGDEGPEHQGKVEPSETGQLSGDHRRGERRGGDQPEQRPSGPVHLSSRRRRGRSPSSVHPPVEQRESRGPDRTPARPASRTARFLTISHRTRHADLLAQTSLDELVAGWRAFFARIGLPSSTPSSAEDRLRGPSRRPSRPAGSP